MSHNSPKLGQTVTSFEKPSRSVNVVFLHCSAASRATIDAEEINQWHLNRGWSGIGYHFFMMSDGTLQYGRNLEITPAAQAGFNTGSIAISLNGLKKSDFTEQQFAPLRAFCAEINAAYGGIRFRGHREVAAKECPVFDYHQVLGLDSAGMMMSEVGRPTPVPVESHQMTITRVQVSKDENNRHFDVKLAQALLLAAGVDAGQINGFADFRFDAAMRGFQSANGLVVDGICGPASWELLEDAGL